MVKWSATEWWAIEIWFDLWSVAASGWVGLGNEMICMSALLGILRWLVGSFANGPASNELEIVASVFTILGADWFGGFVKRHISFARFCLTSFWPPVNMTKRFLHSFEDFCEDFLKCFVFCEPSRAMASMLPPALFLGCNRRSENHWNVSTSLQMASQVPNFVMMHFLLSKFSASWGSMPFLCTKVCSIRKLFVQSFFCLRKHNWRRRKIVTLPSIVPTCSGQIRLSTFT